MKRIKHYTIEHTEDPKEEHSDSYLFHKTVLAKKNARSKDLVACISAINPDVEKRFDEYEKAFYANTLEFVQEDVNMKKHGEELQRLYDYCAQIFQDLRTTLLTKDGILDDSCPCCEKDSCNTFDHLLPQGKYPEFSDNPLNLLPCCGTCNQHKSEAWLKDGKRKYLNLYLDTLPAMQYMFCTMKVVGETLDCSFEVRNDNGIDENLFRMIKNTFLTSDLAKRYKERSNTVISGFLTSLRPFRDMVQEGLLTIEVVRQKVLDSAQKENQSRGGNYWESLIRIACCEKEVFDAIYNESVKMLYNHTLIE